MRPEVVVEYLRRQPFQPLRIYLSDGSFHDVRHPEFALVGKSEIFLARPAVGTTKPIYEDFVLVSLLHINRIEPVPSPASSTANGEGA